jgi:hypothetical protein
MSLKRDAKRISLEIEMKYTGSSDPSDPSDEKFHILVPLIASRA